MIGKNTTPFLSLQKVSELLLGKDFKIITSKNGTTYYENLYMIVTYSPKRQVMTTGKKTAILKYTFEHFSIVRSLPDIEFIIGMQQ